MLFKKPNGTQRREIGLPKRKPGNTLTVEFDETRQPGSRPLGHRPRQIPEEPGRGFPRS